jgi:hypothetical protein
MFPAASPAWHAGSWSGPACGRGGCCPAGIGRQGSGAGPASITHGGTEHRCGVRRGGGGGTEAMSVAGWIMRWVCMQVGKGGAVEWG